MSKEGEHHFSYVVSDEKNTFRHMRNARYITHPYSQSSARLDASVLNDLNQLTQTPYTAQMENQPESPTLAMDTSEDSKMSDVVKLPENLENLPKTDEFPTKRSRWNTNEEILALLLNFPKHEDWQSKDVVIRPDSGSMLMYSRKKVRYRRDGYCWKKRKDGKTTREDHMKLKVQGVECIYGCYVHSAVLPTFHRRCYWLLQNPNIVLVHYLNVPYPDGGKLAALIPNIAFWTEKKEWTREELLLQLKPIYENSALEDGNENGTEEAKLNRIDQVSSFIESMVSQLLEKQRYVRAALANSLECGCGNRKCPGGARCTRPIRRISTSKKHGKRTAVGVTAKMQDRRHLKNEFVAERNIPKTTITTTTTVNTTSMNLDNRANPATYYSDTNVDVAEQSTQVQIQRRRQQQPQNTQQLQHLLQTPSQPEVHRQMMQQQQSANGKELMNYTPSRTDITTEGYLSEVEYLSAEDSHYQSSNYASCSIPDSYVSNNDVRNSNVKKQEIKMAEESVPSSLLLPYNVDENEFAADKYQSDTTDCSDSASFMTIHHRSSPNNSFTSIEDAETYANGDVVFDDLMTNVNSCYNYENGDYTSHDHGLYELIIQLTQKEKKTSCSNSVVTCEKLQQYSIQSEACEGYTPLYENELHSVSDTNGNFLSSCSHYPTSIINNADDNVNHNTTHTSDFPRIDNNYTANYQNNVDVNFMETSGEYSTNEKSTSNHSLQDSHSDPPNAILDLAPEWSYCEGGTKLLIIGAWYFQSEYAVLFDGYSVPAILVQAGVLKCYCPEHAVGLVSVQVASAGAIISNSVGFEYKKRAVYDENLCHNTCNIKAEQYNQYMYENDTLLKFILIQRIEAIQDDAYKHNSSSYLNKYEALPEKTFT